MKKLSFFFLLLPFLSYSQFFKAENKTTEFTCQDRDIVIDFTTDYVFKEDSKFYLNFIDQANKSTKIDGYKGESDIYSFFSSAITLSPGLYKVSIIATNPSVESTPTTIQIIDKNYKVNLSLDSYTKTFNLGETVSLKFNTNNEKYPLHLQLNGFDEIVIPVSSGIYELKFPIERTAFYEIQNVSIGRCGIENLTKNGKAITKLRTTKNEIKWVPYSGSMCENSTSIHSNGFKLYGDFDTTTTYKVKLFDLNSGKDYNINNSFFFTTPDMMALPTYEVKGIVESDKYYFKIFTTNPTVESDLLGPFTIGEASLFSLSASDTTLNISEGDSIKLRVDITGTPPWKFMLGGKEYYADKSPIFINEALPEGYFYNEYVIYNGYNLSGVCSGFISDKYAGKVSVFLKSDSTQILKPDLTLTSFAKNTVVRKDSSEQIRFILRNEGKATATNINVLLKIPYSPPFVIKESQNCSKGTFNSNIWNIPSLAIGDSCILYLTYQPTQNGVWYIEAEVFSLDQQDEDSAPNNSDEFEDDYTRACFSIPIVVTEKTFGMQLILDDPKITINQWYREGNPVQADGNLLQITKTGKYSYDAIGYRCPEQGCCPFIVEEGIESSCCKPLEYIMQRKN
jgi:hypothetical protein